MNTRGTCAKGYQLCKSPTPPQRNNSIEIEQNSLHCFWRTSQGSWQGGCSHIHTYIYQPLLCGSSNWAFFLLIFRHFLRNTFSLPIFKFLDLLWMGRGEVGQEDPWDRAAIALSLFTPCLTLLTLLFLLLFSTLLTSFVYSTLLTFFCTFYFLLHFLLYSFLLLLLLIIHPLSNSSYSLYFYSFYSFSFYYFRLWRVISPYKWLFPIDGDNIGNVFLPGDISRNHSAALHKTNTK